ncbi:hypothetical protein C8R46DRAFT_1293627 [Mycena filopes]|nr:hypothetical protein C8R46DRAFT_1293627 [Mycena filopes]
MKITVVELGGACTRWLEQVDALVKLNLSLVARYVHFCPRVDRAFYSAVNIHSPANAVRFLTLVDSKPADFFANAVKVLIVGSSVSERYFARILHACRGVESLSFWTTYYSLPALLIGQLPLRRLSLRLHDIVNAIHYPGLPPTWLSGLTHLNLVFNEYLKPSDMPTLKRFPNLTHVALSSRSSLVRQARAVIESCEALQVLLILVEDVDDIDDEINELYSFDHRIVVATPRYPSYKTWMAPYLGLGDAWTSAEHVIVERGANRAEQDLRFS